MGVGQALSTKIASIKCFGTLNVRDFGIYIDLSLVIFSLSHYD